MDEETCQSLIDDACVPKDAHGNKLPKLVIDQGNHDTLEDGEIIELKKKNDTPIPPDQDFDIPDNPFQFILKEPAQQVSYLLQYQAPNTCGLGPDLFFLQQMKLMVNLALGPLVEGQYILDFQY